MIIYCSLETPVCGLIGLAAVMLKWVQDLHTGHQAPHKYSTKRTLRARDSLDKWLVLFPDAVSKIFSSVIKDCLKPGEINIFRTQRHRSLRNISESHTAGFGMNRTVPQHSGRKVNLHKLLQKKYQKHEKHKRINFFGSHYICSLQIVSSRTSHT